MQAIAELPVDMLGMIFYEKSPRCIDNQDADRINALALTIPKVGVFVDAAFEVILDKVERFGLQFVQLHGQESPDFCHALREKGIPIIKAFQIKTTEDLKICRLYEDCCDYFLFDTPTPRYGGSGNKFDWKALSAYTGTTPFFLSGGIAPEDAEIINQLDFPQLVAVDLNSRFETAPGIKDIDKIRRFIAGTPLPQPLPCGEGLGERSKTNKYMNSINALFQNKKREILSVYFTAGFPAINDTEEIILALQNAGIDLVEVGIPFSDPLADGPVIQESSTVALRNGMNLHLLFSQLERIKDKVHIPLILMGYLNPVMQYGFENFCKDCQRTGISGMIIPDLPFNDYLNEYKPVADRYDLKIILLITPETSDERIRLIDEHTDGFIYMVSSAATTGVQNRFDEKKLEYFRRIGRMNLRNPLLIGFGISNRDTLAAAFEYASGAIIGSKFIRLLEEEKNSKTAVERLLESLTH